MRYLAIVCLAACSTSSPDTSESSSSIIGGELAPDDVSVVLIYSPDEGSFCSGSVISPRIVLTAAHCVHDRMVVYFGPSINELERSIDVVEMAVHPDWNPWGFTAGADLALLVLAEDAGVPSLPLSRQPSDFLVGSRVRGIGYGISSFEPFNVGERRHALLDIIDVGEGYLINDGYPNICSGDSGGPALALEDGVERIVGVNSFGSEGCEYYGGINRIDVALDTFIAPFVYSRGGTLVGTPPPVCEPDTTPPRITCSSQPVACGDTQATGTARAFDTCGEVTTSCTPTNPLTGTGTFEGTCEAFDAAGNRATCDFTVDVVDFHPPIIESRTLAIPADGAMHEISIADCITRIYDECEARELDVLASTSVFQVRSDEPEDATGDGDGATCGDVEVVDNQTVRVRGERHADGNGRVYEIEVVAYDEMYNSTFHTCRVDVLGDVGPQPSDACGMCAGRWCENVCPVASSTCGTTPPPGRPVHQRLAQLGDIGPGGGAFAHELVAYGNNDRGQALISSGAALYVHDRGHWRTLAHAGMSAPGGGTFGAGVDDGPRMNAQGDVGFTFFHAPWEPWQTAKAGVYRWSNGELETIIVPDVTPAPRGGVFRGGFRRVAIDARGTLVFAARVPAEDGELRTGIYRARRGHAIEALVVPGDRAPNGVFQEVTGPAVNDAGDMVFEGRVNACDENWGCQPSLYLRSATGVIREIARPDTAAPNGRTFLWVRGAEIDRAGTVVFVGVTSAPGTEFHFGLYRWQRGQITEITRTGRALPGGGNVVGVASHPGNLWINSAGEISFMATVDSDDDGDGYFDTGIYVVRGNRTALVVKSGSVLPAIGTIAHLGPSWTRGDSYASSGTVIDDKGEIVYQATLTTGQTVLMSTATR